MRRGIDTLSIGDLAFYDPVNQVVFVKNMLRYQGAGVKNNQAAANQLGNVHNSNLINTFLEAYPEVKIYSLKNSDTLSIPYR